MTDLNDADANRLRDQLCCPPHPLELSYRQEAVWQSQLREVLLVDGKPETQPGL
ncbi:hypothetical protein [Knoellia sinensis]|uniref:hypothetical protein n=1 Tax=Knoellia sinensis TaxID=136100 RepID=UPI0014703F41|nr:hypothetical protein [Knoellia sinensis]